MKHLILSTLLICSSLAAMADHCKATTKTGKQCSRNAQTSGYCKQHDPSTVKCAGKTKSGQPCKMLPSKGSKFCHLHNH